MKKILVFIFTPIYGGPHNQVYRMYKDLLEKGYETVLCVHKDLDDETVKRFEGTGIKIIKSDFKRIRFTSFLKENYAYFSAFFTDIKLIEEIIVTENPHIVQICGLLNIQAAIAAKRLNKKIVWQLLSTFSPQPLRFIYGRLVKKWANVIMSTGKIVARKHNLSKYILKKVVCFYPPVDTAFFYPSNERRKKARAYFGIHDDALIIGTVGNRNRQKAHREFVKIAKNIITSNANKEIYFIVVGSATPSYEEQYKKLVINYVEQNNLSDKIKFFESNVGIDVLMCGFDIFVLTSMAEGVPTVLLEALSTNLPVVSSCVGSVSEIVRQGINGYTYLYKDNKAAVHYLSLLIENRDLRNKIGNTNRTDAVNKFDIVNCIQAHIAAYEEALKVV